MTTKQRKERQNIQHIEANENHRIGTGYGKTLETAEEKNKDNQRRKGHKIEKSTKVQ